MSWGEARSTANADSKLDAFRKACWEVYRQLGFDTDGDDHFYGSDEALMELVVESATEARVDYSEALVDLPNSVDVVKGAGWRVVKTRRQQMGFNFDGEKIVEEL